MDSVIQFFVVDAFTCQTFRGNPAGVVLLDGDFPADDWMRSVAAEFRHSETAFVRPRGTAVWDVRWFTPTVEIDLCGHATLATAHALGGHNTFHSKGGVLSATTPAAGWVELDLPADPPVPIDIPASVVAALGDTHVVATGRGRYDLLVQLPSAGHVRDLRPDLDALGRLPYRGVIVTAPDDDGPGVVTRCFYPAVGVPEDPASGTAQCTIGGWWFDRFGVDRLSSRQLSTRGGSVQIARHDGRIRLRGQAVTVMRGELLLG
jgi:predicted PhzF superfamily epimerase YddE/YHI9